MLTIVTQTGPKRIVVKSQQIGSPEDEHGEARTEHHTDLNAEAGWPLLQGAY